MAATIEHEKSSLTEWFLMDIGTEEAVTTRVRRGRLVDGDVWVVFNERTYPPNYNLKREGLLNMETAKQIVEMLGLKSYPTCGFVAETYRSKQQIPQQALPAAYEGEPPVRFGALFYGYTASANPPAPHPIRPDVPPLPRRPTGGAAAIPGWERRSKGDRFGPCRRDAAAIVHPGRYISHLAIAQGSSFALLGTTEWPGVEPSDVELGDRDKLMADYPRFRDECIY
jgi:hypothetical protein